jgi:hypothetical protein
MGALSDDQVEQFIEDGFVRLEAAFDRALIQPCLAVLERSLLDEGVDVHDERTWRPVVRLLHFEEPPFFAATNSGRLQAAWDQLVGVNRWYPRPGIGTFPIRFPSHEDPGDTGWHIDNSYQVDGEWRVNIHSRNRALLMLFLFSDVGEADAPTRIRVGSHLDVPAALAEFGEAGTNPESVIPALLPRLENRPLALATGEAGDVYLCHPFLVHAAGWPHRGTQPRYIAQPPLALREPLDLDANPVTPLERSIALALIDS